MTVARVQKKPQEVLGEELAGKLVGAIDIDAAVEANLAFLQSTVNKAVKEAIATFNWRSAMYDVLQGDDDYDDDGRNNGPVHTALRTQINAVLMEVLTPPISALIEASRTVPRASVNRLRR